MRYNELPFTYYCYIRKNDTITLLLYEKRFFDNCLYSICSMLHP